MASLLWFNGVINCSYDSFPMCVWALGPGWGQYRTQNGQDVWTWALLKVPRCPGKRHPVLTQSATRPLGIFQDLLRHLKQGPHYFSDTNPKLCQLQQRHTHTDNTSSWHTHVNNNMRFKTVHCFVSDSDYILAPVPPEIMTTWVCASVWSLYDFKTRTVVCVWCGIMWWNLGEGQGWAGTLVESELFMYGSAQWLIPPWSTFSMRATRKISGWGHVTENTPWGEIRHKIMSGN